MLSTVELAGFDEVADATMSPMPPRRRSPDDRLTSGEVAELLRVSQSSVGRIPADELPYWATHGGHRRYQLEHVQAYADAQGLTLAPRPDDEAEEN